MNNYIDVEGTAKNINEALEKAVEKAVAELGLAREAITYELIDQKKNGFLGLGDKTAVVRVFYEAGAASRTENFLKGLFERMSVQADMKIEEEEGRVNVTLEGDDMGIIIGRRGETLDAIQYITALAVNRGEEKFVKVAINSENYREKREEYLKRLAVKTAERVLKYHRSIALDPMAAHDRRIIHATVQEIDGVTTFSTGQEPNRRVVVAVEGGSGSQKTERQGSVRGGKPRSTYRRNRRPRNANGGHSAPANDADTTAENEAN